MSRELLQHFRNYIAIEEKDEAEIVAHFRTATFAKKTILLAENARSIPHFFVIKGCLRMFYLNEKGIEQTAQFAIENWWLTDYLSFERQSRSSFSIQAVEATEVLMIDYKQQEALLAQFPLLERYFRLIYQRNYGALQLRSKYLHEFSREELYEHFSSRFPEFVQRVPQYLLASYLGMTPEYLSEIRAKRRS